MWYEFSTSATLPDDTKNNINARKRYSLSTMNVTVRLEIENYRHMLGKCYFLPMNSDIHKSSSSFQGFDLSVKLWSIYYKTDFTWQKKHIFEVKFWRVGCNFFIISKDKLLTALYMHSRLMPALEREWRSVKEFGDLYFVRYFRFAFP